MPSAPTPPLIGVTACLRQGEFSPYHHVQDKYVDAVVLGAKAMPVLLPAIGPHQNVDGILDRVDGVMLTGSPSNVDPAYYGGPPAQDGNIADPVRDATTLPLIQRAVERGVPVLAICRGIQELNVALGGTLHPFVHEVAGRRDHRSDKTKPYAERYGPVHAVRLTPGGRLQQILGDMPEILVNSLHGQGIGRLADGLMLEAAAEDGTIEAVSLLGSAGFVLGVQWHPEWRVLDNPISLRLFEAFGAAAVERATRRAAP